jgi:hypothetical protein
MDIDWMLVATIAGPIVALFVGAILNRILERRAKVITYYGHVSSFALQDQQRTRVFTHTVVIRNVGWKSAKNVRIGHNILPHYQIYPSIQFEISQIPDDGIEILIPTLVPQEEVHVSYLYFPPITYNQINTYVKSDEGFAKGLNVLLTPAYPRWLLNIFWLLIFIGVTTTIYLLIKFIIWIFQVK